MSCNMWPVDDEEFSMVVGQMPTVPFRAGRFFLGALWDAVVFFLHNPEAAIFLIFLGFALRGSR